MALADHKITDADISTKGVTAAPDKLTGTAAENKQLFDRLIREAVKDCLNDLIDELAGTGGAAALGALDSDGAGSTVQDELDAVHNLGGVTATPAELNILDGATVTTEELNALDGVSENVQSLLDLKQAAIAASGILKGDGAGGVSAAEIRVDYCPAMQTGPYPPEVLTTAEIGDLFAVKPTSLKLSELYVCAGKVFRYNSMTGVSWTEYTWKCMWRAAGGALPEVSASDNGKVLKVVNGVWAAADA